MLKNIKLSEQLVIISLKRNHNSGNYVFLLLSCTQKQNIYIPLYVYKIPTYIHNYMSLYNSLKDILPKPNIIGRNNGHGGNYFLLQQSFI